MEDFTGTRSLIDSLMRHPRHEAQGVAGGVPYRARVIIPDYGDAITDHYADLLPGGLQSGCARAGIPFQFRHFGLILSFDVPVVFAMYDPDMVLDNGVRALVDAFGPVFIRNAAMIDDHRAETQRNIFPHLDFHVDRGINQPNQYSLYSRDPLDPAQQEPRGSSTLFIANIVAHLQRVREMGGKDLSVPVKTRGILFAKERMDALFSRIVARLAWDEPAGTGELGVIDNRTVRHASYHRPRKGWAIGTRYVF